MGRPAPAQDHLATAADIQEVSLNIICDPTPAARVALKYEYKASSVSLKGFFDRAGNTIRVYA